jgi:hypothetical protein
MHLTSWQCGTLAHNSTALDMPNLLLTCTTSPYQCSTTIVQTMESHLYGSMAYAIQYSTHLLGMFQPRMTLCICALRTAALNPGHLPKLHCTVRYCGKTTALHNALVPHHLHSLCIPHLCCGTITCFQQ